MCQVQIKHFLHLKSLIKLISLVDYIYIIILLDNFHYFLGKLENLWLESVTLK